MSETQEADLYGVLGATSCDTPQHLKHKYQQLVLQVNTEDETRQSAAGGWRPRPKQVCWCTACDLCSPSVLSTTRTGSEATQKQKQKLL